MGGPPTGHYSGLAGAEGLLGDDAMRKRPMAMALGQIRTLLGAGAVGGLTDRHLLEQFSTGHREAAEAAFTTLVERHGPMVLRVCRGVIGDSTDVHDAFQAT